MKTKTAGNKAEASSEMRMSDHRRVEPAGHDCCCEEWEGLIWPDEAEAMIFDNTILLPEQNLPLSDCLGLYTAEDIVLDRDHPPAAKALRDGIAVSYSALRKGVSRFRIKGVQEAGQPPFRLTDPQTSCFEICTGALLPIGADTVIPYESVNLEASYAVVTQRSNLSGGSFVQPAAAKGHKGDVLARPGRRLTPWLMAAAAATGKSRLKVRGPIPIAVIGTGNELVEIDQTPKPYQNRRSNTIGVLTSLKEHGFPFGQRFHIRDDAKELKTGLKSLLERFSWLILSGGVSKGRTDLVPDVLISLGCRIVFRQVRQRPGKPFLFMTGPQKQMIFGLPGNPVSTAVCLRRFIVPALRKAAGAPDPHDAVIMPCDEEDERPRTHARYDLVKQQWTNGAVSMVKVEMKTSGDFTALPDSDGFIAWEPSVRTSARRPVVSFYKW